MTEQNGPSAAGQQLEPFFIGCATGDTAPGSAEPSPAGIKRSKKHIRIFSARLVRRLIPGRLHCPD